MIRFGLSHDELRIIELTVKTVLGPGASGSVWIFGSRATGKHRRGSDVDLLIDSLQLTMETCALLCEAFEESLFPYNVDVVDIRKLAPEYAQSIHASKALLFDLQTPLFLLHPAT